MFLGVLGGLLVILIKGQAHLPPPLSSCLNVDAVFEDATAVLLHRGRTEGIRDNTLTHRAPEQMTEKHDYYARKLNPYLLKTLNQGLCYLQPNAFITDIDIGYAFS